MHRMIMFWIKWDILVGRERGVGVRRCVAAPREIASAQMETNTANGGQGKKNRDHKNKRMNIEDMIDMVDQS